MLYKKSHKILKFIPTRIIVYKKHYSLFFKYHIPKYIIIPKYHIKKYNKIDN